MTSYARAQATPPVHNYLGDLNELARLMSDEDRGEYKVLCFRRAELTDEVCALVELRDGTTRELVFTEREMRALLTSPGDRFFELFDQKMAACDRADAAY